MYIFRGCEDAGPRTLEAYGLAQYNPDALSVTIRDELDTVKAPKTYMVTYAQMGWCGEEIDWNNKIYVYVTENYVSAVANVNLDRANKLKIFCFKLACYDFLHSLTPWLMFFIGFIVLLFYLYGLKLITKGNRKGHIITNSIWWGFLVVLILNFFHVFDFLAHTKESNPVVVSVAEENLSVSLDAVTGQDFEPSALKTFYGWNGDYFASSSKLRDTDGALMICAYNEASELLFRTMIMVTLLSLIIAMRNNAKRTALQQLKKNEASNQESSGTSEILN